MKIHLALNIVLIFLALSGFVIIGLAETATAMKYAEFDRARCVDQAALAQFSRDRFRSDSRVDVALWIAGPVRRAAMINATLAIAASAVNALILTMIICRRNK